MKWLINKLEKITLANQPWRTINFHNLNLIQLEIWQAVLKKSTDPFLPHIVLRNFSLVSHIIYKVKISKQVLKI